MQNRRQPLRRKRAQIVAAKRIAGLAEEFDTAKRAAAQRIDGGGPAKLYAFDGVLNVGYEARIIHPADFCCGNPRQTDAGRAVTPLAWPKLPAGVAQIWPIVPLGVVASIFKSNAFGGGL